MRGGRRYAICLCVLSLTGLTYGIRPPAGPTYVPFDRLITNMEAYVRENPDDPRGYYLLARMHYFVFVDRQPLVPVVMPDSYFPPKVAADWQTGYDQLLSLLRHEHAEQLVLADWGYTTSEDVPSKRQSEFQQAIADTEKALVTQGWKPDDLDTATLLAHAATAVDNFDRALDLDPENGLYYLGLASLYEQYRSYTADVNVAEHPRQLAGITVPRIRVMYFLAYRFALEREAPTYIPIMSGLRSLVSYEAGTAYLRLAEKEPSVADSNSVAQVRTGVERIKNLPLGGPITPIIFSPAKHTSVLDLLDPDTHVTFDLDGTGRKVEWPWLKPATGLLVWDPQEQGQITSGRQLFGTATWWLLFPDGYAALDALDDNRDGTLSGAELRGIGVWFDKNTNGRSDPGEVQPVEDFGVQAIRTKASGSDHGMPMNAQGVVLKNGTPVPAYDWLVAPIVPGSGEQD